MKNLFVRILACILVFTMAFAFAACKDESDDEGSKTPTPPATGEGSGTGNWFNPGNNNNNNDDPSSGETCIVCEDADGDLVCDVCGGPVEKPYDPWDDVTYFAVPGSSVTLSVFDIDIDGKIKNIQLPKGSTMLFEFDYTAAAASSFAIKFDAETVKVAFNADGKIAILKGDTQLAVSTAAYTGTSKVAIDWNGAKITVKVNNAEAVSADYAAPAELKKNAELYLLAGTGSKFENTKATFGGSSLEFRNSSGFAWEIITEEGSAYKDALYAGAEEGRKPNGYNCMAFITNVDFAKASKITISANIAQGAQYEGGCDRGFLLEVWNTNGENNTTPIAYEGDKMSFFKLYLGGYGANAEFGKWGATNLETDADNNKQWKRIVINGAVTTAKAEIVGEGPKTEDDKELYKQTTPVIGEYTNLKVEWDRENYIMTWYYNDILCRSVKLSEDIFLNDGSGIGIATNVGDTYFSDFVLIVE